MDVVASLRARPAKKLAEPLDGRLLRFPTFDSQEPVRAACGLVVVAKLEPDNQLMDSR